MKEVGNNMNFPTKWRDTVDPFKLNYKDFILLEVLGYPHAGNDVFYAKGIYRGKEEYVFIKVNRHIDANVKNEIEILNKINLEKTPKIIYYNDEMTYRVSLSIEGERLSTILKENDNLESLEYLEEYGETLYKIHSIKGNFNALSDRKFFHIPSLEYFNENGLDMNIYNYLVKNKPKQVNLCFCHGDFHYANVLWKDKRLSGILDFELSGLGNKEFDIAWAIILRPGQKFLKEEVEINTFLKGYLKNGVFDIQYLKYYMVQIYCWFYTLGDEEYKKYVKESINSIIRSK